MALKEKLIDKAQKLVQKGYLDKAIAEYRAAADTDPRDISIRLRIGDLYVKLGKKAEAIKEYTEVARANAQRGFYLKSIAIYKQILKLEESIEIHNKLAELYVKQRLIADAVGEYSYIVTWFERRGKTNDVLEILKKMVDIDPENIGVRLKLADLYQKLSFDKDALSEYCLIFDKLVSAGKLDTAEKVYLQLYNTNPTEERVLSGLAELYRLKRDDAQRLRYLKALFNYYSDSAMTDKARTVATDIIQIKPDDPHALRLLKKAEKQAEPVVPKAQAVEAARAESTVNAEPAAKPEAPLISWPEEEIEITIEGFESGAGETMATGGSPPEASVAGGKAVAPEKAQVEDGGPVPSAAVEAVAETQSGTGEIEIDIEDLLKGEMPPAEVQAAAEPVPTGPEEVIVPEAAVEEAPIEIEEESAEVVASGQAVIEEPVEAGIEEAISVISTELQDSQTGAVANEAEPEAEAPVEAPTPEAPIDEVIEVPERAEVISESIEAASMALEAIEEAPAPSTLLEPAVESEIEKEAAAEPAEVQEPAPEEGPVAQETVETAEAVAPVEAAPEAEEEIQEDLSSAIQELMEKMEPAEAEAPRAARAPEGAPAGEDYVDLSVELGMEEASKDIAGAWGGNEPAETFDEFKTGIGKQLSKEDSETHYNLGIAYMEMELFGEAAKEFKIALKDGRLELDCYTRLGLCAMAEKNPEEAVVFYSKGLKAASSDEEKKGMMYELALAHEAAGQDQAALDLFSGIFAVDPDFREVASKVGAGVLARPLVPLNDGLIEVELL